MQITQGSSVTDVLEVWQGGQPARGEAVQGDSGQRAFREVDHVRTCRQS